MYVIRNAFKNIIKLLHDEIYVSKCSPFRFVSKKQKNELTSTCTPVTSNT